MVKRPAKQPKKIKKGYRHKMKITSKTTGEKVTHDMQPLLEVTEYNTCGTCAKIPQAIQEPRRLRVATHSAVGRLIHELDSRVPIGNPEMPIMVNSCECSVHNNSCANKHVIVIQFIIREQPSGEDKLMRNMGTQLAVPDPVYRGA